LTLSFALMIQSQDANDGKFPGEIVPELMPVDGEGHEQGPLHDTVAVGV
jgi:hypothetical protein